MRRIPDQNSDRTSTDIIRWPSLGFFLGALKRQFLLASFLVLPVFFLVLFGLSQLPLEYSSNITVLFDTTEGTSPATGNETLAVVVNRITGSYMSRFKDPEFFRRVAKRLPPDTMPIAPRTESAIKNFLQSVLPSRLQPASWALSLEEQQDLAIIDELETRMTPTMSITQFTLNLVAKATDPKDAQSIARLGMDQFIVDELIQRRNQVLARIQGLSALETIILKEKEPQDDLSKSSTVDDGSIITTAEGRQSIKTKEQVLVKDILIKKADFERAQANQEGKLLLLNEELNNLLSSKGITHPNVIQKQREIDKLRSEPVDAPIELEMNRLKAQLLAMQRDMKKRGIPIDRSVQIASFPDETRRSLTEVTAQIRNLENIAEEIKSEILNPAKSRRFTTVREPESSTSPSNKKQLLVAAAAGLLLCLLTFALTILIREINHPQVVSADQLDRKFGVHPTAIVKAAWLRNQPNFDADQIRELRPQLGQLVSKKRPELVLLDSYRHIAQLVDQMQDHQITVVFDTGAENYSDNLASNLTKVLTVDSGRRALFLSFRGRENQTEENTADLMEFLAGKAEWKDVRLKGSTDGSHDTAYARDPIESLGAFREDLVQRLFKSLRDKYQIIVVEAFPPAFNSENGILHQIADAVVLQIRLGETRHEDLQRLLHFMDRRKIAASLIS